jgi:hypothetical protein
MCIHSKSLAILSLMVVIALAAGLVGHRFGTGSIPE